MSINRGNIGLVVGMLIAGTANTVISKYQDMACVKNCDNPDPKTHEHFEQPIWQTLNMFMGETLCLVAASIFAYLAEKYGRAKWADLILDDEEDDILAVVESDGLLSSPHEHGHGHGNGHAAPLKKKKLEGPLVLLLWLPTLCDMTASTVRNTTSPFFFISTTLIGYILSLSCPFFSSDGLQYPGSWNSNIFQIWTCAGKQQQRQQDATRKQEWIKDVPTKKAKRVSRDGASIDTYHCKQQDRTK